MPLKALLGSRKAFVVMFLFTGLCVLVAMAKIPPEYLKDYLNFVVPSWLLAHAGEESAKAWASTKMGSASAGGAPPSSAPPSAG